MATIRLMFWGLLFVVGGAKQPLCIRYTSAAVRAYRAETPGLLSHKEPCVHPCAIVRLMLVRMSSGKCLSGKPKGHGSDTRALVGRKIS